jgi:hypothetical protein
MKTPEALPYGEGAVGPLASSFCACTFEAVSPTNRIIDTLPLESFQALCLHEAAHAAVALALGLTVEEVRVTGTMRLDEATEQLYGLPAGIELPAAGTRIPDEFLETHPRELLAAMAAPSYMPTGVTSIDRYAAAEAASASAAARERGVDPAEVAELSAATVGAQDARIRDLAAVLARQGGWTQSDGCESGLA